MSAIALNRSKGGFQGEEVENAYPCQGRYALAHHMPISFLDPYGCLCIFVNPYANIIPIMKAIVILIISANIAMIPVTI